MGFETPISNHNAHEDLGASNLNPNLCSFSIGAEAMGEKQNDPFEDEGQVQ